MTVDADITLEDLIAFNIHHCAHSPAMRRMRRRNAFCLPTLWLFAMILIIFESGSPRDTALASWPLLLLPIVVAFINFGTWKRRIRASVVKLYGEEPCPRFRGQRQFDLQPGGIYERGDFGEATTRWTSILRVAATDDHVFIYAGAADAIIVPARAFAEPSQFQQFVHEARQFVEAALRS